jgi:hypothetical protein
MSKAAPQLVPPRKFMFFRILFRYVSGRPLDGIARTDSSFLRPATKALTVTGRATRWASLPGWKRAAWRILGPFVAFLVLVAWHLHQTSTLAAGSALAVWGGRRTVRRIKTRRVRKQYVEPLAAVLAKPLRQEATNPVKWVFIPPELTSDANGNIFDRVALPGWLPRLPRWMHIKDGRPAEGRLEIPTDVPMNRETALAVENALALRVHDDLIVEWRGRGPKPSIAFKARPRPPKLVEFRDIAELAAEAPESAPILGLSASGPVSIDIDTDAPHAGLSCGSGAGKSVLIRGVIAQWLRNGVQVVILDGKQTSQRWCKDIPGVRYCRTGEQMHNALIEIQAEVQHRGGIVDSYPAEVDAADIEVGPRIVVVFEEMNIGVAMIADYWNEIKEKGAPKRSPALRAWDHILAAGREFRVHAFAVAQMMTVQASGGNPAARENMGPRILARATRKAWEMLAPECGPPFPKMTKRRGRMYLAFEGEPTEFQSALWTVREAREWALGGTVTLPATWSTPSDLRDSAGRVTNPRFYTLKEASEQEWCAPSYVNLRQHMSRARKAGHAPAGREISGTTKYTRDELVALIEKRTAEVDA